MHVSIYKDQGMLGIEQKVFSRDPVILEISDARTFLTRCNSCIGAPWANRLPAMRDRRRSWRWYIRQGLEHVAKSPSEREVQDFYQKWGQLVHLICPSYREYCTKEGCIDSEMTVWGRNDMRSIVSWLLRWSCCKIMDVDLLWDFFHYD